MADIETPNARLPMKRVVDRNKLRALEIWGRSIPLWLLSEECPAMPRKLRLRASRILRGAADFRLDAGRAGLPTLPEEDKKENPRPQARRSRALGPIEINESGQPSPPAATAPRDRFGAPSLKQLVVARDLLRANSPLRRNRQTWQFGFLGRRPSGRSVAHARFSTHCPLSSARSQSAGRFRARSG